MKVALVTGASKGLGLEWCKQLKKQGYTVVLTGRDLEKAVVAAKTIDPNSVFAKELDVCSEIDIANLAVWVQEKFGRLDLLVNNAGINPKDYSDKSRMAKAFYINELDMDEMCEIIKVNSLSPLIMVKHFRPLLKKSENPMVVNISSWLGSVEKLSFGGHYGYVGSKNLLNVLNKSMALELREDNIVCVNVNPGWVQTDMGGGKATFSTEQSVVNMMKNVVEKVGISDTGKFLNYDGTEHPW